jgi:hypothetical protein
MNVTVSVDPSDASDVLRGRDFLNGLLSETGALMIDLDLDALASPDINELWDQLGPNARRLLWFASRSFKAEEEFTFADIAPKMGLSVESVKAIHRNMSRGLASRGVPVTDVLPSRWDNDRQNYHLPTPIHEAVLRLELGD